jgi:Domain of unknown function (DUF4404)
MSDLQQTLRDLHRELAAAPRLDPAERAMLEAAVADIQATLAEQAGGAGAPSPATPADSLENAAVRIEAEHPGLAGAVRAFVDALAKAGI